MIPQQNKQSKSFLSKLWNFNKKKDNEPKFSLETRFLSFEEGRFIMMGYYKDSIEREYGIF